MSEKTVKVYTHGSNRVKPGKDVGDKKVVFKGLLDNPYRILWPSAPINIQNAVLAQLVNLLDGVANFHLDRSKANKKRKRRLSHTKSKREAMSKKNKLTASDVMQRVDVIPESDCATTAVNGHASDDVKEDKPDLPVILQHAVYGINEVTKRLEAQVHSARYIRLHLPETDKVSKEEPVIKLIFVCRADVEPPILIDHIPHLVAAYNSVKTQDIIKLCPLPKGAEQTLAQVMGVRRMSVIAFNISFPGLPALWSLVDSIPSLSAHWLSVIGSEKRLIPTHIKQFKTTAPKDMKLAKQQRTEGRAAAKQRLKLKAS